MTSAEKDKKEYYLKVPSFDGDKVSWLFYKKKMESYLARLDLGGLLDKNIGESVLTEKIIQKHESYGSTISSN